MAICNHQADIPLYVGIMYMVWCIAAPDWSSAVFDTDGPHRDWALF